VTSSRALPAISIAAAASVWGLWWIPLRQLEQSGVSGDWASVLVFGVCAVILAPALASRSVRRTLARPSFWLIGLTSGAAIGLWNHALITSDIIRVTLLFYLSPIWATILMAVVFRQPLGWIRGLSIVVGLGGAIVILGFEGGFPLPRSFGEWTGVLSGIVFAIMSILVRYGGEGGAIERTLATFVFAFALSVAFVATAGTAAPVPSEVVSALPTLALCLLWQIALGAVLMWGLARLDPGRANILLLLEAVSAAISAGILTDEPFGWREMVGCVLIIGAALLEGVEELRQQARPAQSA
jgi:drug/metabolite transporter (DMT)-like permease